MADELALQQRNLAAREALDQAEQRRALAEAEARAREEADLRRRLLRGGAAQVFRVECAVCAIIMWCYGF